MTGGLVNHRCPRRRPRPPNPRAARPAPEATCLRLRSRPPRLPPAPPKRLAPPAPATPLNLTTRSSTFSPAVSPLVTWVSPPELTPVVTGRDALFPFWTTVTVDWPLE